jgi:hypothetical protein
MEIIKSLQLAAGILQMVSGESSVLNITAKRFVVPLYIYEIPGSGIPSLFLDFLSSFKKILNLLS